MSSTPCLPATRRHCKPADLYGSNETWAGEGIVSGIYNGLSLSAGYTHFETDGWRENADQKDDIANIFAQYQFTDKTSIQAEYRYRDNERGDIKQRFFQEDFLLDQRNGGHHAFGADWPPPCLFAGFDCLGQFSVCKQGGRFCRCVFFDGTDFGIPPPDVEVIFENSNKRGKLRRRAFVSVSLEIHRPGERRRICQSKMKMTHSPIPFSGQGQTHRHFSIPFLTRYNYEIDHWNLYAYTYIRPLENLTLTVGASGDFFDQKEQNYGEEEIDADPSSTPNWVSAGTLFHPRPFAVPCSGRLQERW